MKKILRYVLAVIFTVSMLAVCAFQSFAAITYYEYADPDGNVYTYYVDGKTNTVTITDFSTTNTDVDLVIPDTIEGLPVERIGDSAFSDCTMLKNLDLSGVTVIERYAFSDCTGLKELRIDHDMNIWNYAFRNCIGLEKIIVEDNVNYIDLLERNQLGNFYSDEIFEGCTNVKYIYIGASFLPKTTYENKFVDLAADFFDFWDLSALETIEVSPNNPYYRSVDDVLYVDEGDVYILLCYPRAKKGEYYSTEKALAGVDKDFTIGCIAFAGNQYIKEVNFTKPVIYPDFADDKKDLRCYELLDGSFYDSSVEKVTFPKGGMKTVGMSMFMESAIRDIDLSETERIKRNAFEYCQNLTEANLLSCTDLAGEAFLECTSLKTVNLPLWNGETSDWVEDLVFAYCTALENVNMPLAESLPERCFYGCTSLVNVYAPKCENLERYCFYGCTSLVNVYVPKCDHLGEYCFYGCTTLEKIDMPLDYVGRYAFAECSKLQKITLKYAYVSECAFLNCISLDNIEGVRSIGKSAFSGCVSLKNIKFKWETGIGDSAFKGCSSLALVQFDNIKCTFGKKVFEGCPNVSFYCDENSDAYTYAVNNNIPVVAVRVSFQNSRYEYTGKEIQPSIIVSMGDMTLVQNKDYTLSFENNINEGSALVTVHFIGDFEGLPDAVRAFTITRRDLSSANIEYVEDYIYSGDAIKPAVVVKLDGKTLTEGVDYTIVYASDTDTGTMLFTVKGKGHYTGSIDCYYNIIRRDIAEATVEKLPDCVYTGNELCPLPVLTWNGFTLVCGEDFEVRYFENVNAGFGIAVIYGKGNFCGTQRVKFRIFGKGVENAVVSEIPDCVFDGSEKRPDFTVTLGGVTLREGTDYTAEYINNTEKGMAEVIISGMGNYSGVIRKTFNIYKNSVYSFTVFSETQMTETYDGSELKPEIEVYFGTERLTEGVDYEIRLENNISAGTATVTVIGIGRFEGERTYNFTIQPCEISGNDISVSGNLEFNGAPVEPVITVTKDGKILENGKDYVVTYSDNNSVGTAFAVVEGIGNYCGDVNLEYEIYKNEDKKPEPEKPGIPEQNEPPKDNSDGETNNKNDNVNNGTENSGINNGADSNVNTQQPPSADKNNSANENNSSVLPQIPNTDVGTAKTSVQLAAIIAMLMCYAVCHKTFRKKIEE